MEDPEVIELTAMIISLIAIVNIPYIIKIRKDFIKYLLGIICLIIYFTAGILDELFLPTLFEFIEIISFFCGAILLLIASLIDCNEIFLKKKKSRTKNLSKKKKDC